MKKVWHILSLLILVGFSCKKKEFPESVIQTESTFYFNATVDGAAVSLKSGINKYYMYSSLAIDSSRIYAFIGDLRPSNCNNCGQGIQIKINNFKVSQANEPIQIDSALIAGNYPLGRKTAYSVAFKSNYSQTAASYLWDFGDNTSSTEADPIHTYAVAGNYKVSLRIDGSFCQQYIKNVEKVSLPAKTCNILVMNNSLNTLECAPNPQGVAPFLYTWDFGDGFITNAVNPSHTYKIPGTYPVSLRVIDANHDTSYAKYNHATKTQPMPCQTNYRINSITPVLTGLPLSNVTINWTDESGEVYTSDNILQPSESYFKIISLEEYDLNEKGEKTKKIRLRFKCNVYSGAKVKTLDNVQAVICVAYK